MDERRNELTRFNQSTPAAVQNSISVASGFALGGLTVFFPIAVTEWVALFGGIIGAILTIGGAIVVNKQSERALLARWDQVARAGLRDIEKILQVILDIPNKAGNDRWDELLIHAEQVEKQVEVLRLSLGRCTLPDPRFSRVEFLLATFEINRQTFENRVRHIRMVEKGAGILLNEIDDIYDLRPLVSPELTAIKYAREALEGHIN